MNIDWIAFGELVKAKRKEKSLNQANLADLLGVHQPLISLIERGNPVGLNEDRLEILKDTLDVAIEDVIETKRPKVSTTRKNIFISYSHKDAEYLARVRVHLRPLEKRKSIEAWSDHKISVGSDWRKEIKKALDAAQIAILLISADFLASDFIVDNELPPLLEKAEAEGATIISVILKPCRFTRESGLARYQTVNPPDRPLISVNEYESELIYDAVAQRIEEML
jgi:transcriptional regulator with XRE-family HTH domain